MAQSVRVTLTQAQAASPFGQRLIHQIMAISHDGDLTIEEVASLHTILRNGPADMNAVPFLRTVTTSIITDGQLDAVEAYQLRRAMERVVPKAIRIDLTILLSRIGLPSSDEDDAPGSRRSWRDDPVTARQLEFIRDLGGVPDERLTKGAASELIDDLLARRPPTPRQQMVLRFFDRLDLSSKTKEEVSVWLDDLYAQREDCERAWDRFKIETGDDGSVRDPLVVPIGAFRRYVKGSRGEPLRSPVRIFMVLGAMGLLCALLLFLLWKGAGQ
jgi:hypothetical protein